MSEPLLGHAIVVLVALHRGAELVYARANARRLVAAGGRLVAHDGIVGLVVVHVLWLAGMAVERVVLGARIPGAAGTALFGGVLLVEGLRAWTLATLGRRWTVRVVVVPGEVPIARGPYRFLRHPNYVVVALELLLFPLALGAWRTAACLVVPNLGTLAVRIRREEAAWRATAARPLGRCDDPPPAR